MTHTTLRAATLSAAMLAPWCLVSCGMAPAEIDFGAELTRLTLERQPHDADAINGWPLLAEIARETKARIDAIDRREDEVEREADRSGEPLDDWNSADSLQVVCSGARSPRAASLLTEMLQAEEQAGTFDRLHAVHDAGYFCADYSLRLTGEASDSTDGGVAAASGMRVLSSACLAAMMRDLETGNDGAARQRLEDAFVIADAFGSQVSYFHWLFMPGVESRAMRSLIQMLWQLDRVPVEVAHAALSQASNEDRLRLDGVLAGYRLEAIEMRDLADELRKNGIPDEMMELPRPSLSREGLVRLVDEAYADAVRLQHEPPRQIRDEIKRLSGASEAWKKRDRYDEGWAVFFRSILQMGSQLAVELNGSAIVLEIALHAHRHGSPPATLDALELDVLSELPRDPFADDGRFVYIAGPTLRECRVYSVGLDGEDNGGVTHESGRHAALNPTGEGYDFMIWPPGCDRNEGAPE